MTDQDALTDDERVAQVTADRDRWEGMYRGMTRSRDEWKRKAESHEQGSIAWQRTAWTVSRERDTLVEKVRALADELDGDDSDPWVHSRVIAGRLKELG